MIELAIGLMGVAVVVALIGIVHAVERASILVAAAIDRQTRAMRNEGSRGCE